jgi:serine phosphatase RsbU (regulator of sigma subunit)
MTSLTSAVSATGVRSTPLPVVLPQLDGLDLKARYYSDRCGGDFFDAVAIGTRVVFLLTDIAGRRNETFPFAVRMQRVFRTRAKELFEAPDANESESIALLARDINRSLIEAAHGVRFAPAFVGCFNSAVGVLTYHNAGSLLAVFHDTESVRVLSPAGIPMGLFTHSTYEPAVLAFEPHAKLLLVTKGITETKRGATTFGIERVTRLLEGGNTDSASKICEDVLQEVHAFTKNLWSRIQDILQPSKQHYSDDLTVVALVRTVQPSSDSTHKPTLA